MDRKNIDDWRHVEELWAQALECPEEEREAWLHERCGANQRLRSEVEGLLAAHADVGDRFERVVDEAVAALDDSLPETAVAGQVVSREPDDAGLTGAIFGYIEVHGRLGEGGMGRVYWGTDQRLGRQVALKVLRPELASNPRMVSRLQREARILSQLGHPVICQIHDVIRMPQAIGLVLELVEGKRLSTAIADGVDSEQALVWATDLAEALASAHDVGIVHRDLKPSNIMVTPDGELKILDFGIARTWSGAVENGSTGLESSEDDAFDNRTATGEVVGTLLYMSPEQARGESISPATDVFSLGLVLFELLSGRPAYSRRQPGEDLFEVVRDGRVPTLPGLDADLADLMARLTATAPGSRPSVRDVADRLRWIRSAPRRRRRGRMRIVGVSAVVLFSLIMVWQTYRANQALSLARQETERANLEAQTAMQVTDLLTDFLRTADPWVPIPTDEAKGRTAAIEETLRQSLVEMKAGIARDPILRARLLHDLARVATNLNLLDVARETATESFELRHTVHGADHVEVAESLTQLADVLFLEGQPEGSLAKAVQALTILEHSPQATPLLHSNALAVMAFAAQELGQLSEAEEASRRRLAMSHEHWGESSHEAIDARGTLGLILYSIAKRDNDHAKLTEAKRLFEAIRILEASIFGEDHPWFAMTLGEIARITMEENDLEEAEILFRRAVDILQSHLGEDSRDTKLMKSRLGSVMRRQGKLTEADQILRHVVTGIEKRVGSDHPDLVPSLRRWAQVSLDLGEPSDAEEKLRRALRLAKFPEGHWERGELGIYLGAALTDQGKMAEAEDVLRAVLAADRGLPTGWVAMEGRRELARLYDLWQRPEDAAVVRGEDLGG